jgi:hypothetical protein
MSRLAVPAVREPGWRADRACVPALRPSVPVHSPSTIIALALAALPACCARSSGWTPVGVRGWTSWDLSAITGSAVYGREWLTQTNVLAQSAALATSPLAAAGYDHILIDSFWAADPTQVVDPYGRWDVNSTRFPGGIRAVADAVHARGQKLGIYVNPGVAVAAVKQATPIEGGIDGCTAADIAVTPWTGGNTFWDCYSINWTHPCAYPYIASFASYLANNFTVDFLKLDAVSPGSDIDTPAPYDNRPDVAAWSAALAATGRPIWLTLSWAIDADYAAGFAPHADAVRVADDVVCYCNTMVSWSSVVRLFADAVPWLGYAGLGVVRPDLDSLDVCGGPLDGLSQAEKTTAATLWHIVGSPLVTGNDLTALNETGLPLVTHPVLLGINAAGVPAAPTPATQLNATAQVWSIDYGNGTLFVALFNLADGVATVTAPFADFAGPRTSAAFNVTDVWTGQQVGTAVRSNWTSPPLPAHGTQLLRLQC